MPAPHCAHRSSRGFASYHRAAVPVQPEGGEHYFGSTVCGKLEIGGADRDRTDDPLLAKQVLSQLSYSPGERRSRGEFRMKNAE